MGSPVPLFGWHKYATNTLGQNHYSCVTLYIIVELLRHDVICDAQCKHCVRA